MSEQTKIVLKSYFETGDVPTQGQFVDLIDSFKLQSQSVSIVTTATHSIVSDKTIIDATSVAVVATLPNANTSAGTVYTIIAYNAANLITINTFLSQQIKRVSTDTFTSDTLNAGDILTLISTGTYWQVT
jgi:hypothetical protein